MAISSISDKNNKNTNVFNFFKNLNSAKKQKNSANFLNNTNNSQNKSQNNTKIDKNDPASKIILVKKGQVGYIQAMDTNKDGQISLAEFNAYCEENDVNEKAKLALITAMQSSKLNKQIIKENIDEQKDDEKKEEKKETAEDKNAYAKKGDEKYNEEMDYNKNGVVSYAEYLKYKSEHNDKSEDFSDEKKNNSKTSAKTSDSVEIPTQADIEKITFNVDKTDSQSTVEYEG